MYLQYMTEDREEYWLFINQVLTINNYMFKDLQVVNHFCDFVLLKCAFLKIFFTNIKIGKEGVTLKYDYHRIRINISIQIWSL